MELNVTYYVTSSIAQSYVRSSEFDVRRSGAAGTIHIYRFGIDRLSLSSQRSTLSSYPAPRRGPTLAMMYTACTIPGM